MPPFPWEVQHNECRYWSGQFCHSAFPYNPQVRRAKDTKGPQNCCCARNCWPVLVCSLQTQAAAFREPVTTPHWASSCPQLQLEMDHWQTFPLSTCQEHCRQKASGTALPACVLFTFSALTLFPLPFDKLYSTVSPSSRLSISPQYSLQEQNDKQFSFIYMTIVMLTQHPHQLFEIISIPPHFTRNLQRGKWAFQMHNTTGFLCLGIRGTEHQHYWLTGKPEPVQQRW